MFNGGTLVHEGTIISLALFFSYYKRKYIL